MCPEKMTLRPTDDAVLSTSALYVLKNLVRGSAAQVVGNLSPHAALTFRAGRESIGQARNDQRGFVERELSAHILHLWLDLVIYPYNVRLSNCC